MRSPIDTPISIDTYLPTYLLSYLPTYLPTNLLTYLPTYLLTYLPRGFLLQFMFEGKMDFDYPLKAMNERSFGLKQLRL